MARRPHRLDGGRYVADTERQAKVGSAPTAEHAIIELTGKLRQPPHATTHEIGGHRLSTRRPLYLRNIEANPWVAFVVDDLAAVNPWTPRGVTIRGRAEIHMEGGQRIGRGFDPS